MFHSITVDGKQARGEVRGHEQVVVNECLVWQAGVRSYYGELNRLVFSRTQQSDPYAAVVLFAGLVYRSLSRYVAQR